jgi:DNA polymerase III epsilon subunit-like protein
MNPSKQLWRSASLVAIDFEGSGAQERENEQILEIAVIRLMDGRSDMATAFTTRIDPGRPIPTRPWISPGLSGTALRGQPTLADVHADLITRQAGTYLVGQNVAVDWRPLRRRYLT